MGDNNSHVQRSLEDASAFARPIQAAIYCGAPAGMDAFRVAEESPAQQGGDVESIA